MFDCVSRTQLKSPVECVFQHIFQYFLKKPNPISADKSAPLYSAHWQVSKSFPPPLRLSVFIGLLGVRAITGSRIHPQSCLRGAAAAFLRSRSTACLTGSFWSVRSREMSLFPGGNASTNSRKQNSGDLEQQRPQKLIFMVCLTKFLCTFNKTSREQS